MSTPTTTEDDRSPVPMATTALVESRLEKSYAQKSLDLTFALVFLDATFGVILSVLVLAFTVTKPFLAFLHLTHLFYIMFGFVYSWAPLDHELIPMFTFMLTCLAFLSVVGASISLTFRAVAFADFVGNYSASPNIIVDTMLLVLDALYLILSGAEFINGYTGMKSHRGEWTSSTRTFVIHQKEE